LPRLDTAGEVRLLPIEGTPPSLIFLPKGCNFNPRCPFVKDECYEIDPDLYEKKPGHTAACILSVEEIEAGKATSSEALLGEAVARLKLLVQRIDEQLKRAD
jgi:oligopeptide transport system ATP-binding protein